MNIKKVSEVFDLIQGHQITEEEIYNSFGEIPIYTGKNKLIGYVNTTIVTKEDIPCISYPTKGDVGSFFIKDHVFEANNTGVLIPKKEWKKKINLYWAISQLSPKVKKASNSKMGVGYIGKELMERIILEIPEKTRQDVIGNFYKDVILFLEQLNNFIELLKNLQTKTEIPETSKIEILDNIFYFKGGNSGLTEEFTYYNQPTNEDDKVPILSGATLKANLMGYISRDAKPAGKELKIFKGPAILVVRKGIAGQMIFITVSEFTTNDDTYVLILKKDWEDKINLRWFAYQYQELFFNLVTSKSDNATFNKEYARKQMVKIPDITVQNKIAEKLLIVDELVEKLEKLKREIEELLEYEII